MSVRVGESCKGVECCEPVECFLTLWPRRPCETKGSASNRSRSSIDHNNFTFNPEQ